MGGLRGIEAARWGLADTLNKSVDEAVKDIESLRAHCDEEDVIKILDEMIKIDNAKCTDDPNYREHASLDVIATICSKDSTYWRRLLRVYNPEGYHLVIVHNDELLNDKSEVVSNLLHLGFIVNVPYAPKDARHQAFKFIANSRPKLHLVTDRLDCKGSIAFFRYG